MQSHHPCSAHSYFFHRLSPSFPHLSYLIASFSGNRSVYKPSFFSFHFFDWLLSKTLSLTRLKNTANKKAERIGLYQGNQLLSVTWLWGSSQDTGLLYHKQWWMKGNSRCKSYTFWDKFDAAKSSLKFFWSSTTKNLVVFLLWQSPLKAVNATE